MSRNRIAVVIGTRPEIIKMQPVIEEIRTRHSSSLLFVHTGQHYDCNMSDSFIKELELPQPDAFLNIKSGSHGAQTARIIAKSERVLMKEKPDIVLVEGDTNSALGAAIAASKLKIAVGHVEAGCRSFDKSMPEELNRILIADLASIHFAPTKICVQNLLREGISRAQIHLTGHPIVDLLNQVQNKVTKDSISRFGLRAKEYYLATLHREENVDHRDTLENVLQAFASLSKSMPIFFSIHPRTCKFIKKFKLEKYLKSLMTAQPVSYYEALSLVKYAKTILTDSGGIQQEAALLGTPCVTLRNTLEWVETVNSGVNFVSGNSTEGILSTMRRIEDDIDRIQGRFTKAENIFGRIGVAKRIVDIAENQKSCSSRN